MDTISFENRAKFDEKGETVFFPGITTLCHLPANGPQAAIHQEIIKQFVELGPDLKDDYVALPTESYHMTVVDIAVYHKLLVDHSVDAVQGLIDHDLQKGQKRWIEAQAEIQAQLPVRMTIDLDDSRIKGNGRPLDVPVKPFDEIEAEKLSKIRDTIARIFAIQLKPSYLFHITLYYPVRLLNDQDLVKYQADWKKATKKVSEVVPSFEIGHVELCKFNDMLHFEIVERVSADGL